MRDSYPSDISREQFEPLQAIFEQSKQQTKPRVVDLYDVLCAILYVLKSGCQLMMSSACLSRRRKNVVGEVRINRGRNEKTTFVIVDAKSVKNTDIAEQKGYDAGKKVSGIKDILPWTRKGFPTR